MIKIFTTFYNEKNETRLRELITAITNNIELKEIDKIYVLNENGNLSNLFNNKLSVIPIKKRPTYNQFFDLINDTTSANDINIITNTDIVFDSRFEVLGKLDWNNKCMVLSRWEYDSNGETYLSNRNDSQDSWIFKGKIKNVNGDFLLGVPRCDNRILYELTKAGYEVMNPAYSVKSFHLHAGVRPDYTSEDLDHFVPGPYKYVYPSNLYNLPKTLFYNLTHKNKLSSYTYDVKKVNRWIPVRVFRKSIKLLFNKELPLIGYQQ